MAELSIIVPIYNADRYLNDCVASILAQTYTDFELLLVDDGSTDDSLSICESYALIDTRVRVVHQENAGVSSARNRGVQEVSTPWIVFIDADDWIENDYLSGLMLHREFDLVACSWTKVGTNRCRVLLPELYCREAAEISQAIGIYFRYPESGAPWGKLFKTDIIKRNRLYFDTNISAGEDALWLFQYLFHMNSMKIMCYSGYNYRRFDNEQLSKKALTLADIDYTLPRQLNVLELLEAKYMINLSASRFHMLISSLHRYMLLLFQMGFGELMRALKALHSLACFSLLWEDKMYVLKGERRKLFDYLMSRRHFMLLAVYIKLLKKLY